VEFSGRRTQAFAKKILIREELIKLPMFRFAAARAQETPPFTRAWKQTQVCRQHRDLSSILANFGTGIEASCNSFFKNEAWQAGG